MTLASIVSGNWELGEEVRLKWVEDIVEDEYRSIDCSFKNITTTSFNTIITITIATTNNDNYFPHYQYNHCPVHWLFCNSFSLPSASLFLCTSTTFVWLCV